MNTFRVMGIYWFLNGLVNLPMLRPIQHESIRIFFSRFSDFYDLADAPLLLLVFALANTGAMRKQIMLVLAGLAGAEAVLLAVKGYTYSWPVITCAGSIVVLVYSVIGLWQYIAKMEHDRFENSMAFVYAAMVFAYGTYLIIFLLSYIPKQANTYNVQDSYLMYYIGLVLAAGLTIAGICSYGLRARKGKKPASFSPPRYSSSSS